MFEEILFYLNIIDFIVEIRYILYIVSSMIVVLVWAISKKKWVRILSLIVIIIFQLSLFGLWYLFTTPLDPPLELILTTPVA